MAKSFKILEIIFKHPERGNDIPLCRVFFCFFLQSFFFFVSSQSTFNALVERVISANMPIDQFCTTKVWYHHYQLFCGRYWPDDIVAKDIAIGREVRGSIPRLVKSDTCRQRLITAAMFFRSCVAQARSPVDGFRHSLHASS